MMKKWIFGYEQGFLNDTIDQMFEWIGIDKTSVEIFNF